MSALDSLMERWVQFSRVDWQRILAEAIAKGQERRAAYAQWMLGEVLMPPMGKVKEVT